MRNLTVAAAPVAIAGAGWLRVAGVVAAAVAVAMLARAGFVPVGVGTAAVYAGVLSASVALARAAPVWGGERRARRRREVGVGLAVGALLGAHLLLCTALTVNYHVRLIPVSAWLPWAVYDAALNVPAAETLCSLLFARAWRAASLAAATGLTTGVYVARYLVDPLLPWTLEAFVGAVFYLGLLGVAACLLRAWSGGPWASGAGALVFFVAYRLVTVS